MAIQYNDYDIEWAEGFDDILTNLGGTPPDDDEVFEFMCETKIDIASNAYYELVLGRIEQEIEEQYPDVEVSYYVNARDTHLYIDNESVYSWEDARPLLESLEIQVPFGTYTYEESDDPDAKMEDLNEAEVKEFIIDHNKDFETNYKSVEEFNEGEEYREFKNTDFAKGGKTDDVIMIKIGGDKKYPYYIKKIDTTHLSLANSKDGVDLVVPSHILQHKGESYYDDVRSWLKGGQSPDGKSYDSDYYEKGGKVKWNLSEKEVRDGANNLAKALSTIEDKKFEVHDFEYDKGEGAGFELSIDGEKYAGGSYYVKADGSMINAAIGGDYVGNVKDSKEELIKIEKPKYEKSLKQKEEYSGDLRYWDERLNDGEEIVVYDKNGAKYIYQGSAYEKSDTIPDAVAVMEGFDESTYRTMPLSEVKTIQVGSIFEKGGKIEEMDWDEIEKHLDGLDETKKYTGSLSPKEIMFRDALEQEYDYRKEKGYEDLTYEEIKEYEDEDFAKGGVIYAVDIDTVSGEQIRGEEFEHKTYEKAKKQYDDIIKKDENKNDIDNIQLLKIQGNDYEVLESMFGYAKGGNVDDIEISATVMSMQGGDWTLEEYMNASNDVIMKDSEKLTLSEAKRKLFELNDEAVDFTDEINEAEDMDELTDIIYEEDLGEVVNTYNFSWWGGVRQFIIVQSGIREPYDPALVFVRQHLGGDVRGNYGSYEAYYTEVFAEEYPVYRDRLSYYIEKDGKRLTLDAIDEEGYTLEVVEDELTGREEGDNTNLDDLGEELGFDAYKYYGLGGYLTAGGIGAYLGAKNPSAVKKVTDPIDKAVSDISKNLTGKKKFAKGGKVEEIIILKSYNLSGKVINSGEFIVDYENETITFPSGKTYKVVEDYEYTYKILKTKIRAKGGIKGFVKFLNDINRNGSAFNPSLTNSLINKDKFAKGGDVGYVKIIYNDIPVKHRIVGFPYVYDDDGEILWDDGPVKGEPVILDELVMTDRERAEYSDKGVFMKGMDRKEFWKKYQRVEFQRSGDRGVGFAKGGKIDKKDNNNMLLGGLAGILFGIFTIK